MDARIATVPDAGHMMHHERPADVARLIEAFLDGQGANQ
jgi:pimeloyl-ACP methyl ester carboxylesterase